MKKSFVILIIIIQIVVLFVFENMYSLFKNLEKGEIANIIAISKTQAELQVTKILRQGPLADQPGYFDQIVPCAPGKDTQQILLSGKNQLLLLKKQLDENRGLLFKKTIQSTQLETFRSVIKILSSLTVFLGVFIIACGIYLVFLLRKKGPAKNTESISPFQEYLLEIKNSELELKSLMAAQSKSSMKIEELNKSIINTIHLAVIFVDAGGRIEIFNPAAQTYFACSYAAAKNNSLASVFKDYPELLAFIAASEQKIFTEIESAGRIFYLDVVPVGASGRLIVIRDVSSERKKEKIQLLNTNLMMLGEMAASLAHEIRNSLGVILGYSKAIKAEPEKTGKITKEIHFLTEMMESFLKFARPVEKIKRTFIDLGPIIAANAATHNLLVALPEKALQIESDPLLLNVIFSNLLLNSAQAGARHIKVEFYPDENTIITVTDDGPGIAAAVREKIWLPFFSTRDKGTGMGLATVKKLVSALNGDIQLLDNDRPGATFRIVFYN